MRNLLITLGVALLLVLPVSGVYADEDCDASLAEAKSLYNAGNYQKAKSLFEYVAAECGSSYGGVNTWIGRCQEALTPRLSVSRSEINVGANSGSTSITVESNRSWHLESTSSNLFTVSMSGDNITINYSANPYTSSRSDYFVVATSDRAKTVRINVYQAAKENVSPTLRVSKSSISASSSGTTETITVTSNTDWEVQYASGAMYEVTRNGNTLKVVIHANSTGDSRSDYFNVKTTDGEIVKKISLSQTASSTAMSATIASSRIVHNVMKGDMKCMKIISDFTIYNRLGSEVYVIAWIYDSDGNNQVSYRTEAKYDKYINDSHSVMSYELITPRYESSKWSDFVLYFPNILLNKSGYVRLEIRDRSSNTTLARSEKMHFTL